MIKVLIVYNKIWKYREKIFDLLSEDFDLTVSYTDPAFIEKKYPFKTIYLPVKKLGPFEIHTHNLHKLASNYDVVIGLSDIRWLKIVILPFMKRTYKIGFWGIGVRASYENKFDSKNYWDLLRFMIAKKSDFTIFYSSYPISKYISAGVPRDKLFVANNTTEVYYDASKIKNKTNFLFIGTLYKQKGIYELLNSYKELYRRNPYTPDLLIIGDGPEKNQILDFIYRENLISKVKMLGSIYDPITISEIFDQSIACISPKQAGLSVLNSMGNGTIFVTEKDAITGGEIFNIQNKVNGIVYTKEESLCDIMEWIVNNNEKVNQMNKNAFQFYMNNRTPQMMADSIKSAILFSFNS